MDSWLSLGKRLMTTAADDGDKPKDVIAVKDNMKDSKHLSSFEEIEKREKKEKKRKKEEVIHYYLRRSKKEEPLKNT